jgi:hypothetical protein
MAKKGKDHLKKEHRLKTMYYFAATAKPIHSNVL